ncbi:MAG: formate--phosphoribosylaminoimidazolecarboxamide ligase, partial [Patescibacteria group bacterium]
YDDFVSIEDELIARGAIIVPHGSFVAHLGPEIMRRIRVPHYGTKGILRWESNRLKQRQWLTQAKLKVPKIFTRPKEIDRPVIVKTHGAAGGWGYFLARTPEEFRKKIAQREKGIEYVIQEYIVGVPVYAHYFYSRLTRELEIMSFDRRYESNADSIGRVAAADQITVDLTTSYTIVGNLPIVIRESLLPDFFAMGDRVVAVSQKLEPPGLFGPFCLEGVVTSDLEFYVFEISARIVAGTNPYIQGSPYTALKYDEPMSTGRRIAREIRMAIDRNQLQKVLG